MTKKISRRLFALQTGAVLSSVLGVRAFEREQSYFTENGATVKLAKTFPPAIKLLPEKFLRQLPVLMELATVPGLSIAIVERGRVIWARGIGVKNAITKEPVVSDTVFPAASLGKPVFAYGVLKMHDEKLIDIDRPLVEYLSIPDLADEPQAKFITARHVLSHTTGLRNWRFRKEDRLTVNFKPGSRFSYSGEGFFYLQRVVEHVTGQSISSYMRERVLMPLGMKQSSYIWLPEYEKTIAWGHNGRGEPSESFLATDGRKMLAIAAKWNKPLSNWKYDDTAKATPELYPERAVLPISITPNVAGSLLTTVSEYAQFIIRLMVGVKQDVLSLKETTRREMLTPQVKINRALASGLGWGLEKQNRRNYFWQWGDNGSFKNFVIGDVATQTAIVILTNGNTGLKICERIVNQATESNHSAFLWL